MIIIARRAIIYSIIAILKIIKRNLSPIIRIKIRIRIEIRIKIKINRINLIIKIKPLIRSAKIRPLRLNILISTLTLIINSYLSLIIHLTLPIIL